VSCMRRPGERSAVPSCGRLSAKDGAGALSLPRVLRM
jgi:hypothetical protein